jgi:hypothetical protein
MVEIYERIRRPYPLSKLFTWNHRSRLLQQNLQDLKWLFLQSNFDAIPA